MNEYAKQVKTAAIPVLDPSDPVFLAQETERQIREEHWRATRLVELTKRQLVVARLKVQHLALTKRLMDAQERVDEMGD